MTPRDEIEALIAQCALGDRSAFSALYDATAAKLLSVCLRVLSDRAEAEEALQDSFIKIWHGAGRYRVNGLSPMTWLITIARNTAIDRLRARKSRMGSGTDLDAAAIVADPAPGPEGTAIARGETARLNACLDELPEDRGAAIRGAYLDGMDYKSLAARHGVPLNTMRTWLRRGLQRLKECLGR